MLSALVLVFVHAVSGLLAPRSPDKVPYHVPDEEHLKVPNHYIVKFHGNHTLEDHYANIGLDVSAIATEFTYWEVINTYHFVLPDEASSYIVHDLIRHDQGVVHVTHNEHMEWDTVRKPEASLHPNPGRVKRWKEFDEDSACYNIAMIHAGSKLDLGNHRESCFFHTKFMAEAGLFVNVYVVDSGVRTTHSYFKGRASNFNNTPTEAKSIYCSDGSTWVCAPLLSTRGYS